MDFTTGQIVVIALFGVAMFFAGYMERGMRMENWIKANEAKLIVLAGLFTLWCFYSVVSRGGSEIPRIQALEQKAAIHKQWAEEFSYRLKAHTESIHYGRVN